MGEIIRRAIRGGIFWALASLVLLLVLLLAEGLFTHVGFGEVVKLSAFSGAAFLVTDLLVSLVLVLAARGQVVGAWWRHGGKLLIAFISILAMAVYVFVIRNDTPVVGLDEWPLVLALGLTAFVAGVGVRQLGDSPGRAGGLILLVAAVVPFLIGSGMASDRLDRSENRWNLVSSRLAAAGSGNGLGVCRASPFDKGDGNRIKGVVGASECGSKSRGAYIVRGETFDAVRAVSDSLARPSGFPANECGSRRPWKGSWLSYRGLKRALSGRLLCFKARDVWIMDFWFGNNQIARLDSNGRIRQTIRDVKGPSLFVRARYPGFPDWKVDGRVDNVLSIEESVSAGRRR